MVVGNSTTSTVTSVIRTTLVFDSTTIISSTSIVLVTSTTKNPPTIIVVNPTTTSSSTPSPSPNYLGGFDAIHAEAGGTSNQLLFYTDQLGNIRQINGSGDYSSGYYDPPIGYDSTWSPGSPAVIAQNALPGSPVQAVLLTSGEVCDKQPQSWNSQLIS